MTQNNYITYHLHTEDSLLDSCTNYKLYVNRAKELGQTAIAFSEHGNIFNWIEKKLYCDQLGIKYIHGMECYLTESFDENIRDNFHTVLLAKNYEGVKEINRIFTLSHQPDHFYYKPRISFEEFLNISDNVIKTSACLQSPLYYYYTNQIKLTDDFIKKYNFLEVQYHNVKEQKDYNEWLVKLSQRFNIPLIAGTDTHNLDSYKAECRSILLSSKGIEYSNEDDFDLTYKSYSELVNKFIEQGALSQDIILSAIDNTNVMADMVEDFQLDLSFKYPILYGDNDREVLLNTIKNKLKYKLNNNIIDKKDIQKYINNIKEELKVFDEIGMTGFMLFMSEMITWCWENNIPVGYCRGSVGGSTVAYITDIIDVNPIQWNTIFSRFANKDRKEIGDIDIDVSPSQRDLVFDYIINRFGKEKTAYVLSMGTIQSKGCIDLIGRALSSAWIKKHGVDNNPYSLDNMKVIKDKFEADNEKTRSEYPDLFYYYDGLIGTIISQSHHPAGIVASPINLDEHYGCFTDSEGHKILSVNMEEAHEVSLVKYDILGLQNIQIIRDTCILANIPYPKSHLVNWNDDNVWANMTKYSTGIFQFESDYAFDCLRKMNPHTINDMSLTNAAVRPSGDSYREDLFAGKIHKNPSDIIDELLKDNRGYLIFQEDTIKFLKDICGLEGSEADNVRRAIGRKQVDRLQKALPQILEGYCNVSDKPREVAEEEAKEFLQIIEDSSNYQFGYNHSTGYSMIGYTCAMLRYYYPLEFCASYLNNVRTEDDIANGTQLAKDLSIPIRDIKFGKSESKYTIDKENNCIYKGIASIKYCNDTIAEELLALSKNHYDTFIDLLKDIAQHTSVNSRQLDTLIKLNFFSDFGRNKKLIKVVEIYNKFNSCKIIAKKNLEEFADKYGLSEYLVVKYSQKETASQYRDIDNVGLMNALINKVENKSLSIAEQIQFENEALGYIGYTNPKLKPYYWMVIDFKTYNNPNKPYVTLRRLCDGYEVKTKVKKPKVFKAEPFEKYSILLFDKLSEEHKVKNVDGKWIEQEETEPILNTYNVLRKEHKV